MRIIDLHCYPNTQPWIDCQGPYVKALAEYWKRDWSAKQEDEVVRDFTDAGVDAVLVALDLETTAGTPPSNARIGRSTSKRRRARRPARTTTLPECGSAIPGASSRPGARWTR